MGGLDALELHGAERDEELEALARQMTQWGLVMPNVRPLALHFGLGQFRKVGETEFWVANEVEHGYCGKFLFVFDGQTCPRHHHQVKHETFFVVKGAVRMSTGEEERVMLPGDVLVMPPGTPHSFAGLGAALVLEVSMPSTIRDSFFDDKSIGENGTV